MMSKCVRDKAGIFIRLLTHIIFAFSIISFVAIGLFCVLSSQANIARAADLVPRPHEERTKGEIDIERARMRGKINPVTPLRLDHENTPDMPVRSKDITIDIHGHADEYFMEEHDALGNLVRDYNAFELYDKVKNHPLYSRATLFRLFGCDTGADPEGLAQLFADISGRPTIGMEGTLLFSPENKTASIVVLNDLANPPDGYGRMRYFKPRGIAPLLAAGPFHPGPILRENVTMPQQRLPDLKSIPQPLRMPNTLHNQPLPDLKTIPRGGEAVGIPLRQSSPGVGTNALPRGVAARGGVPLFPPFHRDSPKFKP
jgi:hypothetical protein